MKMFLDQRRPYNKFTLSVNGEYLFDSTGSNNKSVIIVLCTSRIKDFVDQRAKGELINRIFNATSA